MTLASTPLPARFHPLRFAARELRGGLRGFYVFIACIALGVLAVVALLLAFALHLAIDYTMNLFLFHWIMMLGLVSFLEYDELPGRRRGAT